MVHVISALCLSLSLVTKSEENGELKGYIHETNRAEIESLHSERKYVTCEYNIDSYFVIMIIDPRRLRAPVELTKKLVVVRYRIGFFFSL